MYSQCTPYCLSNLCTDPVHYQGLSWKVPHPEPLVQFRWRGRGSAFTSLEAMGQVKLSRLARALFQRKERSRNLSTLHILLEKHSCDSRKFIAARVPNSICRSWEPRCCKSPKSRDLQVGWPFWESSAGSDSLACNSVNPPSTKPLDLLPA